MNLRELAQLVQLSPSAVSLALRGSLKISAATKKRVRNLARKVGYRPDPRLSTIMSYLRKPATVRQAACLGVISFYEALRPWESSIHLARVHNGMMRRANELGYRLEPLYLRAPGMNVRRFRSILEARGIEGLLCLGAPDFYQDFPAKLDVSAIVTQGLSVRTPLHRVTSHTFNDTVAALDRLHQFGYLRPGLVLGQHEDLRCAHLHSAAYLGWCEHRLGLGRTPPICRLKKVEPEPLLLWLKQHRPDALVFVHNHDVLDEFRDMLRKNLVRVSQDVGVVVISPFLENSGFDGLQENQRLIGARMVELLTARIAIRDFGIPTHPHIEMVESYWIKGNSLRRLGSQR
jgi:LacI family transcriptional regulator